MVGWGCTNEVGRCTCGWLEGVQTRFLGALVVHHRAVPEAQRCARVALGASPLDDETKGKLYEEMIDDFTIV